MAFLRHQPTVPSALLLGLVLWSCEGPAKPKTTAAQPSGGASQVPAPSAARPAASAEQPKVSAPRCPDTMQVVAGGPFWVGGDFNDEERPNYETVVADFCMGTTEVTVSSYARCVEAGKCKAAHAKVKTCNSVRKGHENHPINCVDHRQATAYCQFVGARLPTELEWEYAARGGGEYRNYSWGNEHPDGRNCWKHPGGSCEVKSYPSGAFGLYDMTGNVWEWTQDWYGPYPWPRLEGHARVYRGGSWSRRFVKWMRPQLRNRAPEWDWGSHLGFRCALTPSDVECPFGKHESGAKQGQCRHGVRKAKCSPSKVFNGVRCSGAEAPRCHAGYREMPGYGCVRDGGEADEPSDAAVTDGVRRERSPEFDGDCRAHTPERPKAFRYVGGNHAGRNVVGRKAGCKNRDVGAGWNSACCP